MAYLRTDVVAVLVLMIFACSAQWQPPGAMRGYPISGSEGPCGPPFGFQSFGSAPQQQQPTVRRQPPANAPRRVVRQALGSPPAQGPSRVNLANLLGVPPGMSVQQAAALELDPNNPYDMDFPEQGAFQPGMMDVANGRGPINPGVAQQRSTFNRQPQPANTQIQRTPAVGRWGAPAPQSPNLAYPNQYPSFPYAPQMNCQCDRAGDCNIPSRIRGSNYNHQCIFGYVCCCRSG